MGDVQHRRQGLATVLTAADAERLRYEVELQRVCADLGRMIRAAEPAEGPRAPANAP